MSGAHAAHRTPSKPLYGSKGQPIPAVDGHGRLKLRLVPGVIQWSKKGRPLRYGSLFLPGQRQVLDFRPPVVRPSKHRAGRMKPMTTEERRVRARFNRQHVQASKTRTIDRSTLRAIHDEVASA